ncbi:MAG: DJ-1/PfpI family protein [Candidatus Omnitrophica bacterium]|nr:DJ-1/PfpI family protein [Candidatus Omnitrophota bacterium]
MKKKAVVLLAEGFEDVEAITPIDILKRAGIEVVVAGVGGKVITGSRTKIKMAVEAEVKEINFVPDALILPGGMPGAENLANSQDVKKLIRAVDSKGGIIAAICASPAIILGPMGLLDGRKATCFPGMEEHFPAKVKFVEDNVAVDGNIITSRAPGTALEFSLKIVEALAGKEVARTVADSVVYRG